MPYASRIIDAELDDLLGELPAIALEGPKGVGKTATATQRATTVQALDQGDALSIAEADPQRLLRAEPPILIDEWQRLPPVWDLIRRSVDGGAAPGTYLLAGSTSPIGLGTHSGAGRIAILRMRPLSFAERGHGDPTVSLKAMLRGDRAALDGETALTVADYAEEIATSGFPGIRRLGEKARRIQLDGYLERIVDRDFPELGHELRNPAGLRRWMAAYAAASSTTTTFEKIRDAATAGQSEKPSRVAAGPYRNILERLWILDPLPAWVPSRNRLSRLGASPKHQMADPALVTSLLKVDRSSLLEDRVPAIVPRDGTLLGALFESLATLSVRVYAEAAEASVGHLRTHSGKHEVDLIVEARDGRVLAIEVKLKQVIRDDDVRHLRWLKEAVGDQLIDALVISTGTGAYRRSDGIAVVPLALLGP